MGVLAAAGAVAGLAAIAVTLWLLAPVRGWVANIRGEGEFAEIAPKALEVFGFQADISDVRKDVAPFYEAHRPEFDAIAHDSPPTLAHGLRRLELWSDLKLQWARSLDRRNLPRWAYEQDASKNPHPMDRLLLPPTPTASK